MSVTTLGVDFALTCRGVNGLKSFDLFSEIEVAGAFGGGPFGLTFGAAETNDDSGTVLIMGAVNGKNSVVVVVVVVVGITIDCCDGAFGAADTVVVIIALA